MHLPVVQRILGLLLMFFSATLLPPAAIAVYYDDGQVHAFGLGLLITLGAGLLAWLPARRDRRDLRIRDGFLVAAVTWLVLGAFGAIPLLLATDPALSVTDAVFETVSGLTTTGATALSGLGDLPHSVLYYRAQLQWLGGMGVIVLAVAILPMLGVGGMQLYRAETPGPLKDDKLTPRITETAKALWLIYLLLTLGCGVAFWLAGMSRFDAVTHSFATVSTGGFSTHDASLGHFRSPLIEGIAIAFMFLGAVNFSLHFLVWRGRRPWLYLRDAEFRAFTAILAALAVIVTATLFFAGGTAEPLQAVRLAAFQTVSFLTTSGFTTADVAAWPGALPLLLVLSAFIGGCGGSTAGGMKVIRWLLLYNQGRREIHRLVHPRAELPIRLGGTVVPQRVVDAVWGFCVTYILLFAVMLLVLVATGLDQVTAFGTLSATLTNLGPGLGAVAVDFTQVGASAKWVSIAAMLLGRLEIFTLLVLVSPAFWKS